MKKFFKFAVVALAAAAVVVACQKPATNNDQQQIESGDDTPTTANLFVVNTPGWDAPAMWAWGNDAIKMPGEWPNGIDPEAGTTLIGGKEYVHFVLGKEFFGDGIGFLIVNKTDKVQTVDAAGLTIKAGDNLYYEIGAEAGADSKFPLTKVE
jgi:hypothetical protein